MSESTMTTLAERLEEEGIDIDNVTVLDCVWDVDDLPSTLSELFDTGEALAIAKELEFIGMRPIDDEVAGDSQWVSEFVSEFCVDHSGFIAEARVPAKTYSSNTSCSYSRGHMYPQVVCGMSLEDLVNRAVAFAHKMEDYDRAKAGVCTRAEVSADYNKE